jgi:organic radical activating enzyme
MTHRGHRAGAGVDRTASYTAASTAPLKILRGGIVGPGGRIVPVHLQFNPTNRCNLKCSFCSCSNRQMREEMPLEEALRMIAEFARLGTRAVTITGGGEPLLHPGINEVIRGCRKLGMKSGMVSNGLELDALESADLEWLRISWSDDREMSKPFQATLKRVVNRTPRTDWAFSYVLTRSPRLANLKAVMQVAADLNFTHVRVVSDLLDVDHVIPMDALREDVCDSPGFELTILQGRKQWTRGARLCRVSLLKPVVGPDGGVWPCCGVQYASSDPSRDLTESMRMCHWTDFEKLCREGRPFDGTLCDRCYYSAYNSTLDLLTRPLDHEDFV